MDSILINNSFCTIVDDIVIFHSNQTNIKINDIKSISIIKESNKKLNILLFILSILFFIVLFFVTFYFKIIFSVFSVLFLILFLKNNINYHLLIKLNNHEIVKNKISEKEKDDAKKAVSLIYKKIKTTETVF